MSSTSHSSNPIVIIGGGLAGANAAEELRALNHEGPIILLAEEAHLPYERPPLSKDLLLDEAEPDDSQVHTADWYAEHDIDVRTGARVAAIDPEARVITLENGDHQRYDTLLLATGARPRRLPMADESGAPVLTLRTLEDSLELRTHLGGNLLIIGAGWIGLEVAAAARHAGGNVTVVETSALPLGRVLGPEIAPVFADLHRRHGVDLRVNTSVESIAHEDGRTTVQLSDGARLHPDLILVGIGVQPADELASAAGLAVDGGVLVDGRLRSSDPFIFAAGDVANHDHPTLGRLRVEHWDTAIQHGRHVARTMLGDDTPYTGQPYFYTDQYDLGMEYVGHTGPEGYDELIIRGNLADLNFNVFWVTSGRVAAGMHVNDWDAIDSIRSWVGNSATPQLRDTEIPLSDVAPPLRSEEEGLNESIA